MSDASAAADARPVVPVICGPTASGKSDLAYLIARSGPCTIVSADSRQVYRWFDIGTAKPTPEEREAAPHRCIDVADPTERYSAARWAEEADRAIEESIAAGRRPIVVGGTGLYLRALFEGLFAEPPLDEDRRREVQRELEAMETEELRRWAERLDPDRAHLGRAQLLRAVEIALLTGRRVSELHREVVRVPRWRPKYLVIDPGDALGARIARRIDRMFDNGWADEVEGLMQRFPEDAPAWNATGYGVMRRYVRGELSRAAAHEQILIDTRQYAKRQRTWFRHQLPADATRDATNMPSFDEIDGWSVDWTQL